MLGLGELLLGYGLQAGGLLQLLLELGGQELRLVKLLPELFQLLLVCS